MMTTTAKLPPPPLSDSQTEVLTPHCSPHTHTAILWRELRNTERGEKQRDAERNRYKQR
jgi:hypothetical protein